MSTLFCDDSVKTARRREAPVDIRQKMSLGSTQANILGVDSPMQQRNYDSGYNTPSTPSSPSVRSPLFSSAARLTSPYTSRAQPPESKELIHRPSVKPRDSCNFPRTDIGATMLAHNNDRNPFPDHRRCRGARDVADLISSKTTENLGFQPNSPNPPPTRPLSRRITASKPRDNEGILGGGYGSGGRGGDGVGEVRKSRLTVAEAKGLDSGRKAPPYVAT